MNLSLEEPPNIIPEGEFIPNAFVVNALIFNAQGEILLLKRKENHKFYPGYWGLVMEKVKEGESFKQSVFRGIKEELGLDVEDNQVRTLERDLYKEWLGKKYQVRRYLVRIENANIVLNSEHDEYMWLEPRLEGLEGMDIMPDAIDMIEGVLL